MRHRWRTPLVQGVHENNLENTLHNLSATQDVCKPWQRYLKQPLHTAKKGCPHITYLPHKKTSANLDNITLSNLCTQQRKVVRISNNVCMYEMPQGPRKLQIGGPCRNLTSINRSETKLIKLSTWPSMYVDLVGVLWPNLQVELVNLERSRHLV